MKPEVSIVIPVYNREKLVAETIHSIINQTFLDWECILVDDGSNDRTYETLIKIQKSDSRLKVFERPVERKKGANSCRNYGLEKASGTYVIWFDSDDLMTKNHIEEKVKAIEATSCDFVVSQTANFKDGKLLEPYKYEKKDYGIEASDFILLKIHWYTYDVLVKREVAQKITWNEEMNSWQDYNYFCKMLLVTVNGAYVNKVLTHRRLHAVSIQSVLIKEKRTFQDQLLKNHFLNYKDICNSIDKKTKQELIFGMMNLAFSLSSQGTIPSLVPELQEIIKNELGLSSGALFILALLSGRLSGKGHLLLEMAKKKKN